MFVLAIAFAGGLGALGRFATERAVRRRHRGPFPLGTFLVNVSGSFVLGLVAGLALYHGLANAPKTVAGTGFCGGFTTFSTASFESLRLFEQRAHGPAVRYLAASLVAPLVAAAIGLALTAA
jgi:CrcB protein